MSDNNRPQILDLDAIRPPERKIKLAGKEIDVTLVPFDAMLDILDNYDKFKILGTAQEADLKGDELKDMMLWMYETTMKICGRSDGDITKEWLEKNTDIVQMISLMGFVIQPLLEKLEQSKNLLAAGLSG